MEIDEAKRRSAWPCPPPASAPTTWLFSSSWLNLAAYLASGVGYLLGVLTATHLTVPGFLLLTACNLGWLACFQRLEIRDARASEPWWLLLGMCVLSIAVAWGVLLGIGYDWLLPVVTVSVATMAYRQRYMLPLTVLLYLSAVIPLFIVNGPFGLRNALDNQFQLAPGFAFVYLFSLVMRQQQAQRARAETLVMEIEEAHRQLRAYADQVEELTITRERNRMAREIHDTLGHYLTLLAVQLETALKLEARGDQGLRTELTEARRVTAECLGEVRRSVAALRPVDPTSTSFKDALAQLVTAFQLAAPATEVALDVEGELQALTPELRMALYRCAQEALTNTRKHAEATKVLVRARADTRAAELTVLDNGVGVTSSADGHAPGFGLLGISERIALLGGTTHTGPATGHGWRVEVRVPLGIPASAVLAAG